MYAQLWKTRLTNVSSWWALIGLGLWAGLIAMLDIGGSIDTPLRVLGFVLLSFLIPSLFVGDNKQYRALGLTRKQGFISELMILIPLTALGFVLFAVGGSALTWGICIGLLLLSLPLHYWGIADRKADEKVQRFFTAGRANDRHTGAGWRGTPAAQQIVVPAAKATAVVTVLLAAALATGGFLDAMGPRLTDLTFYIFYFAVFLAGILTPGMILAAGGAGAWHAFGLPRKQYLGYGLAATFLSSVVSTGFALLIAGAIDMGTLTQSVPKLMYAWLFWTVMSMASLVFHAYFNAVANALNIFFMIFYLSTFVTVQPVDAHTVLMPYTGFICLIVAAIALVAAYRLLTSRNGKRMPVPAPSLSKARA